MTRHDLIERTFLIYRLLNKSVYLSKAHEVYLFQLAMVSKFMRNRDLTQ
jgi:hypothetical protein